MNLVTVHRSFNPAEAEVVRSRLEASEFDVTMVHDLASLSMDGYALAAGGILLQVPENQAVAARELIAVTN
jgi:hypothetical protein